MNTERLNTLIEAWADSNLTLSEATELSVLLRNDAAARAHFRATAAFYGLLHVSMDALSLEQAASSAKPSSFVARSRGLGIAAALLFLGLMALSLGWVLASPEETARARPIEIHDGNFELIGGPIPAGFPRTSFTWGGDPSAITAADAAHPHALKFVAAAGEPNVPNSPQQSCDVFQIIDLHACQTALQSAREAIVELKASFLDARTQEGDPVRFICKIYVFEGSPKNVADFWPPSGDQIIGSGAQFYIRKEGESPRWKTVTSRCVLPPSAGFLVVQIGAGSAGRPGKISPRLGEQFADDISLTLQTRHAARGTGAASTR